MTIFKNSYCNNEEINFDYIQDNLSKTICPNLYKIVQVAITLLISSATSERAFSAMKTINTALQSAIDQDHFNYLAILSIEMDPK